MSSMAKYLHVRLSYLPRNFSACLHLNYKQYRNPKSVCLKAEALRSTARNKKSSTGSRLLAQAKAPN